MLRNVTLSKTRQNPTENPHKSVQKTWHFLARFGLRQKGMRRGHPHETAPPWCPFSPARRHDQIAGSRPGHS
jgi:hypothetical protein